MNVVSQVLMYRMEGSNRIVIDDTGVFQAHLAAVQAPDQVEVVMDALLRNRKIAQATHNIMAYRISVPSKGVVSTGIIKLLCG